MIFPKKNYHTPKWFIIDASEKTLGRISTEISKLLRGKENTFFTPGIMIDVDNVYHNILISEEFNEWHSKLCPNKTLNRWPIGNIDLSNTTLPTKISDEVLEYSFE